MPKLNVNGAELYYEERGSGEETIVFSHGFLFSCRMFDKQVEALAERYRCIAFDHRGQGESEVTKDGYDIDNMSEDARGLIEALDLAPCHFAGLSMGGFVGMRLAFRYPGLFKSLTLLETSADTEPDGVKPKYKLLGFVARWFGLRLVIGQVMPIMFGKTFLNDPAREQEKKKWRDFFCSHDRRGVTRTLMGFVDRASVYEEIADINIPTLIIVGDEDVGTPPEKSKRMQDQIPNSQLVIIPGAGHSSPIEEPAAVTEAMGEFLSFVVEQLDSWVVE